jgi:hypothetical protein
MSGPAWPVILLSRLPAGTRVTGVRHHAWFALYLNLSFYLSLLLKSLFVEGAGPSILCGVPDLIGWVPVAISGHHYKWASGPRDLVRVPVCSEPSHG